MSAAGPSQGASRSTVSRSEAAERQNEAASVGGV